MAYRETGNLQGEFRLRHGDEKRILRMRVLSVNSNFENQLNRQFAEVGQDQASQQAWFQLKPGHPGEAIPTPERTKALANDLVQRVTIDSGESPEKVQILDQLGSLRVMAKQKFLHLLSLQPEVLTARTTDLPGFELIRPVKAEPVRFVSVQKKAPQKKSSSRRGSGETKSK